MSTIFRSILKKTNSEIFIDLPGNVKEHSFYEIVEKEAKG